VNLAFGFQQSNRVGLPDFLPYSTTTFLSPSDFFLLPLPLSLPLLRPSLDALTNDPPPFFTLPLLPFDLSSKATGSSLSLSPTRPSQLELASSFPFLRLRSSFKSSHLHLDYLSYPLSLLPPVGSIRSTSERGLSKEGRRTTTPRNSTLKLPSLFSHQATPSYD